MLKISTDEVYKDIRFNYSEFKFKVEIISLINNKYHSTLRHISILSSDQLDEISPK